MSEPSGTCWYGRYTCGSLGRSSPRTRTSPTTPTTVRSLTARWKRLPIGSSFGQCRFANDSLTTATKGCSRVSRRRDVAPAPQRNAERREEARRDVAQAHAVRAVAVDLLAGERHRPDPAAHRHRQSRRRTRRSRTPGSARTSSQHAVVELRAPGRSHRTWAAAAPSQRQHVVRDEPGIDRLDAPDRADQQPRRDEQHDRRRDLDDDERGAQPLRASARRPRAAAQRVERVAPPRAHRGRERRTRGR